MPNPRVLALDIGTSSVRASVYDRTLIAHRTIQVRYRWRVAADGTVEADPQRLLGHLQQAIDAALADEPVAIEAVGIAAFWHSLMGVNAGGRPLTPLLPWSDRRAGAQVKELQRRLDEPSVHARTGCRFHMSYWPARLRWFRAHHRDVFARVARWVTFPEWVEQQWLGRAGVSTSQASGTGLMQQETCRWDPDMLAASRIDERRLGPISDADQGARLRPRLASRWPALARARWIPAAGDGALNNVGAGCARRDRAAVMVGTSGAMRVLWAPKPDERVTVPFGLWRYRLDRRRIVIGGALSNGGNVREWLLRMLAQRQDDPRVNRPQQVHLQRLADALPPDAHGLTILPFLAGARSPDYLADARGTIDGLTLDTRPEHLLRAMMEAVAYGLGGIADELRQAVRVGELVAAGGGLERSAAWTQIIADTLGRPVRLCPDAELTSRGAAALALEQLECLRLEDVDPPRGRILRPDPGRSRIYRRARARQDRLRRALLG
ncbi:gluconokinase [soil metagenome]